MNFRGLVITNLICCWKKKNYWRCNDENVNSNWIDSLRSTTPICSSASNLCATNWRVWRIRFSTVSLYQIIIEFALSDFNRCCCFKAEVNKNRGEETTALISHLEKSIASYKEEYALLISQAQAIKTDLENVQGKVDRSIALLKSLTIEQERYSLPFSIISQLLIFFIKTTLSFNYFSFLFD